MKLKTTLLDPADAAHLFFCQLNCVQGENGGNDKVGETGEGAVVLVKTSHHLRRKQNKLKIIHFKPMCTPGNILIINFA